MKFHLYTALKALSAAVILMGTTSCSDKDDAPEQPKENSIPGQEVGIKELRVSVPRLSRFDKVVDHVSCRIHLRGRKDRVNYPVNIFLSADKDSLYIEADDPILAELPHQQYHLNAITFAGKDITSRSDDSVKEDTVYIGARLSIEDPNHIHFRSSFNVGANSIGSGTEDDPWIIASGDDFMVRISDPMTRGETHEGKYFEITRNLNLNTANVAYGKGWEPAGHNNINGESTDFNGTINGCDNYIENLYCYTDAGYGGLFYSLGEKAYIHNIELRRVMLSGNSYLGAFACHSKTGCRLDSIEVDGTIEGKTYIGGLIGSGNADVRVCISSVDIVSTGEGSSYIGGMIGYSTNSSFTDCIRTGRIDAPKAADIGGYVGQGMIDNRDVTSQNLFTRCYVSGVIHGKSSVGGFMGRGRTEFTQCHAGATLPQDSYAYTLQWDIFGLNNKMTPMPLEVQGTNDNVGGFAGYGFSLKLHGDNSFAYSSPAKPNITTGGNNVGALAGFCNLEFDASSTFTSYAYVQGADYTGGIIGEGYTTDGGTFVNYGNVVGKKNTGGIIGESNYDNAFKINCKNTGNVQGTSNVGGIIGNALNVIMGAVLENDGNVTGSGDCVGGLVGSCVLIDLGEGSHVSSENGSMKISGNADVGGIAGHIQPDFDWYLSYNYCPVYANIISSGGNAGGIFGSARVCGNRKNIELFKNHSPVRVAITVTGGDNVGGAIGRFEAIDGGDYCIISGFDDKLQATITTKGNIAGGIIGRAVRHMEIINVNDCHSFATITSTATSEVSGFGGIVGWYENYFDELDVAININTSSFHGSLSGPNMTAAGGLLGQSSSCDVRACYNAGRVDAVMSVGGIVGRLTGEGYIANCFNMGEVPSKSGRKWLAGILGQKEDRNSEDVIIYACYNVGQTGWGIVGGEDKAKINRDNCLYLDTASNGDMKGEGSTSVTADKLRTKKYKGFNFISIWEFHNGTAAPTLKDVPMFNEKLPLQK